MVCLPESPPSSLLHWGTATFDPCVVQTTDWEKPGLWWDLNWDPCTQLPPLICFTQPPEVLMGVGLGGQHSRKEWAPGAPAACPEH